MDNTQEDAKPAKVSKKVAAEASSAFLTFDEAWDEAHAGLAQYAADLNTKITEDAVAAAAVAEAEKAAEDVGVLTQIGNYQFNIKG